MLKSLSFALLCLLLAGCESMPTMKERVRDRFAAVVPKVSVYEGDTRTVYLAAQAAFKRLDYTVTRANLGGLRIEAVSRINTSAAFRDSRQLIATVKIAEVGLHQSEVTLQLREQLEGEGLGGASELALREHGFYETYFTVLQQVLAEEGAARAAKKN